MLQCVAVCCSVLQCVAVWHSVLQCVAAWCSVLQESVVYYNSSYSSYELNKLFNSSAVPRGENGRNPTFFHFLSYFFSETDICVSKKVQVKVTVCSCLAVSVEDEIQMVRDTPSGKQTEEEREGERGVQPDVDDVLRAKVCVYVCVCKRVKERE